jgi:hypothetical protein
MSPSAPLTLPWQYPVTFPISSVRPLQRWRWVAGIEDVDAVPPHRHERARGETIDRLPFAFVRMAPYPLVWRRLQGFEEGARQGAL